MALFDAEAAVAQLDQLLQAAPARLVLDLGCLQQQLVLFELLVQLRHGPLGDVDLCGQRLQGSHHAAGLALGVGLGCLGAPHAFIAAGDALAHHRKVPARGDQPVVLLLGGQHWQRAVAQALA